MQLRNDLQELTKIYEQLALVSQQHGIPSKVEFDLGMCMDELFSNIVNYAFEDGGEYVIELLLDCEGNRLTITLSDNGKAFNPLEAGQVDLEIDIMDRDIGGLGIYIVSKVMTHMSYSREDGKNKMVMVKEF